MDQLTVIYFCRGWMHGLAVIHQRRHCLSMVIWQRDAFVTYLPFSDIARGQAQNPRHNGFISSRLPQSVFSPKPCLRLYIFRLFRRNHVADVFFDYSGKPSPKPISSLPLFFVLSTWCFYSNFGNLVWTPFDNIGCSTSFSRSTTRGSTVSLMA